MNYNPNPATSMKYFDPLLLQGLPYKNGAIDLKKLKAYQNITRCFDALVLACFVLGIFSIPFASNPLREHVSIIGDISLCAFFLYIFFSIGYIYLWNKAKITHHTQEPLIICDFNHMQRDDKFYLVVGIISVGIYFLVASVLSFINICFLSLIILMTLRVKIFCLKSLVLTQDALILRYRFYGDYALSLESLIVVPENQLVWGNNEWGDVKSQGIWIARIVRKDGDVYLYPILSEKNAWFGLSNLHELYNSLSKRLEFDIVKQTQKPFLFNYKLKETQ